MCSLLEELCVYYLTTCELVGCLLCCCCNVDCCKCCKLFVVVQFNSLSPLQQPDGPGLAGTRMSLFWIILELRMMKVVVTSGTIRRAKFQSNSRQSTNQPTPSDLQAGCLSCMSPNQQCQSTEV